LHAYKDDLDRDPPHLGSSSARGAADNPISGKSIQSWTSFLHDSSGHQTIYALQRFNYKFSSSLSTRVEVSQKLLSSSQGDIPNIGLFSGLVELRGRLNSSLSFGVGAGAVRFSDGFSRGLYRAHVEYQPMEKLWTHLEVERHAVSPTAEAAGFHLTAQGVSLGADWRPGKWEISGTLARHNYSDGNNRKEETFEALRWFGEPRLQFGAGYGVRHLAFDASLGHGYFSPAQYHNQALATGLRFRVGKHYRAEYMTHIGAESFMPSGTRLGAEVLLQNRWQWNKWDVGADYFYYHLAQNSGAFRANIARFVVNYRF
jgi:hypothetical protein